MSRGQLQFRMPGGETRERAIDEPSLAIGRDPSVDLVLDHGSVAEVHALVLARDDGVFLVDQGSAVGTFVNDQRLVANEPVPIEVGDAIRLGLVEGVLAPPAPSGAEEGAVATLDHLRLELAPPESPIEPGWVGYAHLGIRNTGESAATVTLRVEGLPSGWAKGPEQLTVAPNATELARIAIRPPRDAAPVSGTLPLALVVTSESVPGETARLAVAVTLLRLDDLVLAVVPERSSRPVDVVLQSRSTSSRRYALRADDLEQALAFEFAPASLEVPAGAEARARLTVRARRRPLLGLPRDKRYQVEAAPTTPGLAATKTIGEHVVRPRIPAALSLAVLAAIVALVIAYPVVCARFGLPGCRGIDIEFTAEPAEISPGGQALLTWTVSGADSVEILPSPGAVPLSGSQAVSPLQSTAYVLRATGDGDRAERTALVSVVGTAPIVASFAVEPATVVRGQAETITLAWAAPGADSVTIGGVEGVFPAAGSTVLPAPGASQQFVLVARNAVGSATAQATVEVIASACRIAAPDGTSVSLLEGPGPTFRVITLVAPGTEAEPIGRTSDGDWALVTVDNRDGWIGRDELSCEQPGAGSTPYVLPTVDPALIPSPPVTPTAQPTEAPPTELPTETPTPTATETATPTATPTAI